MLGRKKRNGEVAKSLPPVVGGKEALSNGSGNGVREDQR